MCSGYSLGRRLGSGQFGEVREAVNNRTGEVFACKCVEKQNCGGTLGWLEDRQIRSEIQVGTEIAPFHRGLVRAVDVQESSERCLIFMEMCTGGNLYDYVKRRAEGTPKGKNLQWREGKADAGPTRAELVEVEAAWVLGQLASALAFMHSKGALHRDLKPENCFITEYVSPCDWLCGISTARQAVTSAPWRQKLPDLFRSVVSAAKERLHGMFQDFRKKTKVIEMEPLFSEADLCRDAGSATSASSTFSSESSRWSLVSLGPLDSTGTPRAETLTQSTTGTRPTESSIGPRLKIGDFGLAECIGVHGAASDGLVGSLPFIAPEVIKEEEVSYPSDIWSLGVILFFLLSDGVLPFLKGTREGTLRNVESFKVGDLDSHRAVIGISPAAKEVLKLLISPDPTQRPTALEILGLEWVKEKLKERSTLLTKRQ